VTIEKLMSFAARGNRIWTIEITQDVKKRYDTALDVVMKRFGDQFMYRIYEGKTFTEDIDWTSNSEPDVSQIVYAIEKGVAKRIESTPGKAGRPSKGNTLYAQCMDAFNTGKRPADL